MTTANTTILVTRIIHDISTVQRVRATIRHARWPEWVCVTMSLEKHRVYRPKCRSDRKISVWRLEADRIRQRNDIGRCRELNFVFGQRKFLFSKFRRSKWRKWKYRCHAIFWIIVGNIHQTKWAEGQHFNYLFLTF